MNQNDTLRLNQYCDEREGKPGHEELTRFSYGSLHDSMKSMFTNELACDISFICQPPDGERSVVHAHKFVLIARSPVFRAMFCGSLGMQTTEIEILDTSAADFRELLRYLYYEEAIITEENVIYILYNAHKYMAPSLAEKCITFASRVLGVSNVCRLYEIAKLYDETQLKEQCERLIQGSMLKISQQDSFLDITRETLLDFLSLSYLNIPEADLVLAVTAWAVEECRRRHLAITPRNKRKMLGDIIFSLRLPTLTLEELEDVFTSEILSSREITAITSYKMTGDSSDVNFSVEKRRRNSGLKSNVRLLERSCNTVIFAGRWSETKINVTDDITLLGVGILDSAQMSNTIRATVLVTQDDETLYRYGVNIQQGRRMDKLGAVCAINFPNPPKIRKGAFQIAVCYRFSWGEYGTVPSGTPMTDIFECDGVTLNFDTNISSHICDITFCPI